VENRNHRTWRAWRSMTVPSYANRWHRDADEGYRQIFLGRYETAQGMRHAAIWRQNSDRPTWRYRQDVENHIAAEMLEDDVPGVAVAVMQGGEFTFLRGFGKADIDENIDLDSDHVLRWASVSKALGGALTMRMHDRQGIDFDRNTSVQQYFPDLPDHHLATPEQLASNRGCVRHYANDDKSTLENINPIQWELEKDEDAFLKSAWFANAQAASYVFHDDPLRDYDSDTGLVSTTCTPGVEGSSLYSTHGYTFLAAALEGATGHGIKELIQYEIAGPLNLTTLRQEELNDGSPRRAKLYKGEDNDEVEMDSTTWKTLGGGLESTIKDMAKFGRAVIAKLVFADTDYVFNGPNGWSYAYGWNLYDQNGHRAAGKSGGQLGSDAHLIVYPDDDTVIAVMINREEFSDAEDHATDIAQYIGDTIFGP
jgi:CubicO group peptidase (beta-lactamase class C family)